MFKRLVEFLAAATLVRASFLERDVIFKQVNPIDVCPAPTTVTVIAFHDQNPEPTCLETEVAAAKTVTIEGPYIQCQPSETIVYIAPYCSDESPQPTTFIASTAGQYQLGQLVIPCITSTAIKYYAPTIVIVNNIQITLTIGSATTTGDISSTSSSETATPTDDYYWTCSGALDIDEIAAEINPIITTIEEELQMTLTDDQIQEVDSAFYYKFANGSNTTTVDLSFLESGYMWDLDFVDYEDPLDPWINCSTPYNISVDYPSYYNFGNGSEENPDYWDVSEFVLDNGTDASNSTYRLRIRQSSDLLTPNSRLYNADLWAANGMDVFMKSLLTTYPALKTPSPYGFIADMLDAAGLGNSVTGFQKCDISTCDQIEWKDAWTDQQKKVYYIYYAIRTRMLWLKTINENLNIVQTNTQGNMQAWIDRWWPTDVDRRGATVDSGIADYCWKIVAELTGLIPYVGKVVKFGVTAGAALDAKRRDALAVKLRGTSWAEFTQSFTGTGGLLDTFRNGISISAEALNGDPTAETGAITTMTGGNFFGQPTPFNGVAWRTAFETYIKHMVAAAILRMQNVAFVYAPTSSQKECEKLLDDNWRSFSGQTCTSTGLWLPIRANYYETHAKSPKWGRASGGVIHHSYNFALIEFKSPNLISDMGSSIFQGLQNCQKKISWRTAVYPDTGIGSTLGSASLPAVTDTCIYNMPMTVWQKGVSQDSIDWFKVAGSSEKQWAQAQGAWMMAKIGFYKAQYRDKTTSPSQWSINFGGK